MKGENPRLEVANQGSWPWEFWGTEIKSEELPSCICTLKHLKVIFFSLCLIMANSMVYPESMFKLLNKQVFNPLGSRVTSGCQEIDIKTSWSLLFIFIELHSYNVNVWKGWWIWTLHLQGILQEMIFWLQLQVYDKICKLSSSLCVAECWVLWMMEMKRLNWKLEEVVWLNLSLQTLIKIFKCIMVWITISSRQ